MEKLHQAETHLLGRIRRRKWKAFGRLVRDLGVSRRVGAEVDGCLFCG